MVLTLPQIPGHHFPPIIVTIVAVYLACVFGQHEAFGSKPLAPHTTNLEQPRNQNLNGILEVEEKDTATADDEEPVLYDNEKSFFKVLFFGIPNWRDATWSYITIGFNILLALFTLDMVFRGPILHPAKDLSFTRVGFVGSSSAKVLIREPDPAQLPMYVYLTPADKTSWTTRDTVYYLGPETDYTHAVTFDSLLPSKKYIYSLSNDKTGTFITAPSPYSEASNKLTFLTSSCMKANFPYRPTSHSLAFRGFEHLSKVLKSLPSPASFMLFLGDFIYVDVPMRLSSSLVHYRSEYRRVYASPSWSLPGLDSLPWIHTLDDHEIANDWSGGNDTDPFPAASDPFIHYHVSVNPPVPPGSAVGPETNTTYFQFSNGPASFFMLDTRRYRTDPEPVGGSSSSSKALFGGPSNPPSPPANHSMLGATQLASLLKYLATPEPPHINWKIVATSVPFTKNWRFGTSDTWGGFLRERAQILAAMHAAERDLGIRVIILSGDRHEFAAIRYPPPIVDFTTTSKSDPQPQNPRQNRINLLASSSSKTDPGKSSSGATTTTIYDRTPQSGPHEFSVGPLSMFYLPFRAFKQIDEQDVAIKYLPDGNSKVGVVEIHNLHHGESGEGQRSLLKYSLYVDGVCLWEYTLTSPAADVAAQLKGRNDAWRMGLGVRRWLWA